MKMGWIVLFSWFFLSVAGQSYNEVEMQKQERILEQLRKKNGVRYENFYQYASGADSSAAIPYAIREIDSEGRIKTERIYTEEGQTFMESEFVYKLQYIGKKSIIGGQVQWTIWKFTDSGQLAYYALFDSSLTHSDFEIFYYYSERHFPDSIEYTSPYIHIWERYRHKGKSEKGTLSLYSFPGDSLEACWEQSYTFKSGNLVSAQTQGASGSSWTYAQTGLVGEFISDGQIWKYRFDAAGLPVFFRNGDYSYRITYEY